jgi:hypothetical protein
MKKKIWLFVLLAVIIFAQSTILSSFFHPIQTEGFAFNNSLVEIGKTTYVYGSVSITISGPSVVGQLPNGTQVTLNPIVQFPNGTKVVVNSSYSFQIVLPRTGDCYCNGGTGLIGVSGDSANLDQSHPFVAAVVANISSFLIDTMPKSGSTVDGLFQFYWFLVLGDASVSITGYSVAY